MAANINLGKLTFVFKGDWSATATYLPLEAVRHKNSLWYAPIGMAPAKTAPDENIGWVMMLKGYGLSSAIDSTDGGTAATSLAVKTAYDKAGTLCAPGRPGIVQVSSGVLLTVGGFVDTDDFTFANGVLTMKRDAYLEVWGQGGGGGGGGGWSNLAGVAASGGSSGEWATGTVFLPKGTVVPCTIGAGGAGGYGVANPSGGYADGSGKSGGSTSFGNYLSVVGGWPGVGGSYLNSQDYQFFTANAVGRWSPSRPGGITIGGNGLLLCSNGKPSVVSTIKGGEGGNSCFGCGGSVGGWAPTYGGSAGCNGIFGNGYGAGGGGGSAYIGGCAGGAGAPGCIYIERIA